MIHPEDECPLEPQCGLDGCGFCALDPAACARYITRPWTRAWFSEFGPHERIVRGPAHLARLRRLAGFHRRISTATMASLNFEALVLEVRAHHADELAAALSAWRHADELAALVERCRPRRLAPAPARPPLVLLTDLQPVGPPAAPALRQVPSSRGAQAA